MKTEWESRDYMEKITYVKFNGWSVYFKKIPNPLDGGSHFTCKARQGNFTVGGHGETREIACAYMYRHWLAHRREQRRLAEDEN